MKTFIAALLLVLLQLPALSASEGSEKSLTIGALSSEHCGEVDDQRYWYPRVPPYVGFSKGERTTAGGDGTCYLGYPKAGSKSATIMVNGKLVRLIPTSSPRRKIVEAYRSSDNNLVVEVLVTGYDSTCTPGEDKCCGDYTYSQITVTQGDSTATVKAARYSGG